MTIQELIDKLRALPHDAEESHAKADSLLLDYIGDAEVMTAFDELPKWYA